MKIVSLVPRPSRISDAESLAPRLVDLGRQSLAGRHARRARSERRHAGDRRAADGRRTSAPRRTAWARSAPARRARWTDPATPPGGRCTRRRGAGSAARCRARRRRTAWRSRTRDRARRRPGRRCRSAGRRADPDAGGSPPSALRSCRTCRARTPCRRRSPARRSAPERLPPAAREIGRAGARRDHGAQVGQIGERGAQPGQQRGVGDQHPGAAVAQHRRPGGPGRGACSSAPPPHRCGARRETPPPTRARRAAASATRCSASRPSARSGVAGAGGERRGARDTSSCRRP